MYTVSNQILSCNDEYNHHGICVCGQFAYISVGIDGQGANGYCTLEKGGHLAISECKLTFASKWECKLAFNPISSEILG